MQMTHEPVPVTQRVFDLISKHHKTEKSRDYNGVSIYKVFRFENSDNYYEIYVSPDFQTDNFMQIIKTDIVSPLFQNVMKDVDSEVLRKERKRMKENGTLQEYETPFGTLSFIKPP